MDEYICDGEKYTMRVPERDVIALPVSIEALPEQITVAGVTLLRRTSFHVSLVCIGELMRKYNISIANLPAKVADDFCMFTKTNDISLTRYTDVFRFVESEERKTIVVMCEVTNLERFFDHINHKYELTLPYPPTHVTLFTLQQDKGRFLVDDDDISRLSRVIPRPEGVMLP